MNYEGYYNLTVFRLILYNNYLVKLL